MENETNIENTNNNEEIVENNENINEVNENINNETNVENNVNNELLAGKYKTQEELINGYLELQKQFSSKDIKTNEEVVNVENNEVIKDNKNVKEELENKGLDFDKYTNQIVENGTLNEESYKELSDLGLPKEIVDNYIKGQITLAQTNINEYNTNLTSNIGGEDNYNKMLEWAGNNLNEQEINTFNKILDSGDLETTKFAIDGLYNRFQLNNQNSNQPQIITGNNTNNINNNQGYKSKMEYVKDINDKRYNFDKGYTENVRNKMALTDNSIVFS
jgi:hypothetical protein